MYVLINTEKKHIVISKKHLKIYPSCELRVINAKFKKFTNCGIQHIRIEGDLEVFDFNMEPSEWFLKKQKAIDFAKEFGLSEEDVEKCFCFYIVEPTGWVKVKTEPFERIFTGYTIEERFK